MNPLFHTDFSISDSLKNIRKSVLIYETIIICQRINPNHASISSLILQPLKPELQKIIRSMQTESLSS